MVTKNAVFMRSVAFGKRLLKGKSERQKEYLLHMLLEMAEGMDKLL